MSSNLNKTLHLSNNELQKYHEWAKELQIVHFKECEAPLDGLSITFELTNLGTTVVAHTGCAALSGAHVILRD